MSTEAKGFCLSLLLPLNTFHYSKQVEGPWERGSYTDVSGGATMFCWCSFQSLVQVTWSLETENH